MPGRRVFQNGQHLAPCAPFASAVFNLDQVEGLERPQDDVPLSQERRIEIADRIQDAQRDQPEKYSCEELVAVFGAAFLCGFTGLRNAPPPTALRKCRSEPQLHVLLPDRLHLFRISRGSRPKAPPEERLFKAGFWRPHRW